MKKITVLFGNYGSGKTELALNMALAAKKIHDDVTLIDFDVINPYFRSSKHKAMLEQHGVCVIAPLYANTGIDLPSLPPDIYSAFTDGYSIFDCGGDAAGATALGSLKPSFDANRDKTQVLFVVNTMRPFQQSIAELKHNLEIIEASARLKTDGFVLNSNLGKETTGFELAKGYKLMLDLSQKTGIPLKFVSGTREAIRVFKEQCIEYNGDFITITTYMRPDWMENS